MLKKVLAVVLLLSTVKSLLIPLNSGETRCMIIYTAGESDSAKVTMSLPILP